MAFPLAQDFTRRIVNVHWKSVIQVIGGIGIFKLPRNSSGFPGTVPPVYLLQQTFDFTGTETQSEIDAIFAAKDALIASLLAADPNANFIGSVFGGPSNPPIKTNQNFDSKTLCLSYASNPVSDPHATEVGAFWWLAYEANTVGPARYDVYQALYNSTS